MISRIDPHDGNAFTDWYRAKRAGWLFEREGGAIISLDGLRGMVTLGRDDVRFQLYAAWEGDRIVGTLMVELPLKENRRHAEVTVTVSPEHRNRGLGTRLLGEAERVMVEEDRTVALAEVPHPRGRTEQDWPSARFAAKHGFEVGQEEDTLTLDVPVGPGLLDGLRPDTAPYRLREWTGYCPDELVEAYAHLRTVMERDVPVGDLRVDPGLWDVARVRAMEGRRAAVGTITLITAAEAPSGELVGFTVLFLPTVPGLAYQEDTLVVGEHRGRRLGMALKVHNLERLAGEYPDRSLVRTWNAVDNRHMLDINLALGFRSEERFLELQRTGS